MNAVTAIRDTFDGFGVCRPSGVRLSTWARLLREGIVTAHYSVIRIVDGKKVSIPCDIQTFNAATRNAVDVSAFGAVTFTMDMEGVF